MTEAAEDRAELKVVVEALLEEHGNAVAATQALMARAEAEPQLLRKIVNGHLSMLCQKVVGRYIQSTNASIVSSAKLSRSADLSAWAGAVEEGLMNSFRLPGGKLLGDATKADLLTGANAYDMLVGDMVVKGRWLRMLAAKMPDDKAVVRAALTEDKVAAARIEARQDRKAA